MKHRAVRDSEGYLIKIVDIVPYYDAAHGWYRVKASDCKELGIYDQISAYSYQSRNGTYVYLEEDADFALLIEALRFSRTHLPFYNREHFRRDRKGNVSPSPVRRLPAFQKREA
jgi:hypothetical protein